MGDVPDKNHFPVTIIIAKGAPNPPGDVYAEDYRSGTGPCPRWGILDSFEFSTERDGQPAPPIGVTNLGYRVGADGMGYIGIQFRDRGEIAIRHDYKITVMVNLLERKPADGSPI